MENLSALEVDRIIRGDEKAVEELKDTTISAIIKIC
jgi:hypothetical protein